MLYLQRSLLGDDVTLSFLDLFLIYVYDLQGPLCVAYFDAWMHAFIFVFHVCKTTEQHNPEKKK